MLKDEIGGAAARLPLFHYHRGYFLVIRSTLMELLRFTGGRGRG